MPSLRFIIHCDMSVSLFGFPTKKNDRLDVARLLQMDVKTPENQSVRSRKYINGFYTLKIAIFSTALVLGNRSMCLFLLYISRRTDFPIVSTHRSEEICQKTCDFPSIRLYCWIMYRYESLSGYSYEKGSSYFVIRR